MVVDSLEYRLHRVARVGDREYVSAVAVDGSRLVWLHMTWGEWVSGSWRCNVSRHVSRA